MMEDEELITKEVTLLCQTETCENYGIEIVLTVPVDCENYFCGPCSQRINANSEFTE